MPNLPERGQWQLAHNDSARPFEILTVDFIAKSGAVYQLSGSSNGRLTDGTLSKLTVTAPDKFAAEYLLGGRTGKFDAENTATGLSIEFAHRKGLKIAATPLPPGNRPRTYIRDDRQEAMQALQAKNSPKDVADLYAMLNLVHRVNRTYKDREGSDFSGPGPAERAVVQKALDGIYEWLRTTLDDSKLERHFRFNHGGMSYSSAQFAALRILDAAGTLKRNARDIADRVWDDQIKQIEQDDRYIKSLLGEADAQPTTADKIGGIVVLGALAIPIIGAAVVTLPEVIAALGTASLSATFAIPYGSTALAFIVENWAVSEVVAYFAVGTIVNIADAGGIEGFAEQLKTPEGAFQTIGNIVFFIVQVRGARGNGYVRVRAKVVDRTPKGVQLRVESVEPVEPPAAGVPKLGNLRLDKLKRDIPGRPASIKSMGAPPENLKQKCAPSITGARLKYGERTNTCEAHQDHHMENLPKEIAPERVPSPIGGAHEIVVVTLDGKRYTIDSSAKQFVREPGVHTTGLVDIQKIKDLDASRPTLHLMDALNSGIFSAEQYDEFKRLCGSL
jgi:hypothetical protein